MTLVTNDEYEASEAKVMSTAITVAKGARSRVVPLVSTTGNISHTFHCIAFYNMIRRKWHNATLVSLRRAAIAAVRDRHT